MTGFYSSWATEGTDAIFAPHSYDTSAQLKQASERILAALAKPSDECDDETPLQSGCYESAPDRALPVDGSSYDGPGLEALVASPDNTVDEGAHDMHAAPPSPGHFAGGIPAKLCQPPCEGFVGAASSGPAARQPTASQQRDKARFKHRRREKRMEKAKRSAQGGTAAKRVAIRRAALASAITAGYSTVAEDGEGPTLPAHLPIASTAFVSRRQAPLASANNSAVTKWEALKMGLRYVEWDGHRPFLLLDRDERVIGALVGMPRDDRWSEAMADVCAAFAEARSAIHGGAPPEHRRGRFTTVASGISYGGGQVVRRPRSIGGAGYSSRANRQEPSNRTQPTRRQSAAVADLLAHAGVKRIAGFESASLRLYAPMLHAYYSKSLDSLLRRNSKLTANFSNSVFASTTFNLGPQTATYPHIDHLNLPSGLCAVTALGEFDPRNGGHLILWDLELIVEFPPGATVLIPSALIRHSNTPVQSWEKRYSMTQYSAGGLFHWIECGFRSQKAFDAAGYKHRVTGLERWAEGLARLSTLTDIHCFLTPPLTQPGTMRCTACANCCLRNHRAASTPRSWLRFNFDPQPYHADEAESRACAGPIRARGRPQSFQPPTPPPPRQSPATTDPLSSAHSPTCPFPSPTGIPFACQVPDCGRAFMSWAGLTQHMRSMHPNWMDAMPPLADLDEDEDDDDGDSVVTTDEGSVLGEASPAQSSQAYDLSDDDDELPLLSDLLVDDYEDDHYAASHIPSAPGAGNQPSGEGDYAGGVDYGEDDDHPMNYDRRFNSSTSDRDLVEEASDDELNDGPSLRQPRGRACDADGRTLPLGAPPTPPPSKSADDWSPYSGRIAFELADLLYRVEQMSASNIKALLELWAASLLKHGESPPFSSAADMYDAIDSTPLADVKWESFSLSYSGDRSESDPNRPPWMGDSFSVFHRDALSVVHNMLANPDFKNDIDYAPYRETTHDNQRRLEHFMLGEWAWRQANIISEDPAAADSTFVPVILGSDKTTVSVATGQNEYYPLYCSIGNVHNNIRRAHRNAVAVIGFLAIPKTNKRHSNDPEFRKFRRQLFHTSLGRILRPLRRWMERPEVIRCGDGHFRKAIYGIGPYIADYPEQALLACIVQGWCAKCLMERDGLENGVGLGRCRDHTEHLVREFELGQLWNEYGLVGDIVPFTNDFPRADIHELLAPDILHQIIKGTFKDHLVAWVEQYLKLEHGEAKSLEIMTEIDRRIAIVPPFSQLRHFHEGRGFKQWTGDDSKALMKVYLPAVDGLIPPEMVQAFRHFLEFCYLVRREVQTAGTVLQIKEALDAYHDKREVFRDCGVRPDGFSLPRQHAIEHYPDLIWEFGAPNGLCSSITESKHIKAVKEPWRRSNRYEALGQMLLTNQRLDKLAAARVDFAERGMLDAGCLQAMQLALDPERAQAALTERRTVKTRPRVKASTTRAADLDDGYDAAVSGPRIMATVTMAVTARKYIPEHPTHSSVGWTLNKIRRSETRKHASTADGLGAEFNVPSFGQLIRRFLFYQLHSNRSNVPSGLTLSLDACPPFDCGSHPLMVYYSATATFYAPSDPSGEGGMRREIVRANPNWRGKSSRFDCVFINKSNSQPGLLGMDVARLRLLFAFRYRGRHFDCAVVHWYKRISNAVDSDTGMWIVEPSFLRGRMPLLSVVHLNTVVRAAHLIGAMVGQRVPDGVEGYNALDKLKTFYVNKYADHHAFELLH
ncbi:LOW QUALITY PROTEIN: hypothetical protein ACG7TL_008366 [Trametes sanguinea]